MEIRDFTEAEAAMGVRYAYSVFGFTVDKEFLRKSATLALQELRKDPKLRLYQATREALSGVRFEERAAYVKAIAKMLGERSASHSHRKVAA